MNFVNTILKKTPFKSEASEENEVDAENRAETEKKDEASGGVGAGVGFMSNILKSTFKSESSEPKETAESDATENKDENGATAAGGGFISSVWKGTSLFRGETNDGNKERKESLTGEQQKDETGAAGFISNVFDRTTSIFKGDASTKRKPSESFEPEKEVTGIEEEELTATDATGEPISQKAIDSAKSIGSFFYSVANKAGQTVSATAKHLKHTVESNSFLMDFTKEQQEFIKEHGGNIQPGEAPWVGCEEEEEVKKQILSLSQDKRNFVRSPPSGVQFDFDMQQILPVAVALLKEDESLNKMRFEIVPKLVNEETFWRNYFYRVSLIKQSTSLSNMNKGGSKGWASSSSSEAEGPDEPSPTGAEPEFISDSIRGNLTDEDLRKGMRQMGVEKNQSSRDDKQWEDEITKDLQEFEVVNSDVNTAFDEELEKDLANL